MAKVLSTGLVRHRKAAGYTQEALADALGVTRGALGMWEIGKAWPSAALLPKIADLLLCTIDDLYEDETGCNVSDGQVAESICNPEDMT